MKNSIGFAGFYNTLDDDYLARVTQLIEQLPFSVAYQHGLSDRVPLVLFGHTPLTRKGEMWYPKGTIRAPQLMFARKGSEGRLPTIIPHGKGIQAVSCIEEEVDVNDSFRSHVEERHRVNGIELFFDDSVKVARSASVYECPVGYQFERAQGVSAQHRTYSLVHVTDHIKS